MPGNFSENVYIINRILHVRLWIRILQDKIRMHARACNILYIHRINHYPFQCRISIRGSQGIVSNEMPVVRPWISQIFGFHLDKDLDFFLVFFFSFF